MGWIGKDQIKQMTPEDIWNELVEIGGENFFSCYDFGWKSCFAEKYAISSFYIKGEWNANSGRNARE